LPGPRRLSAVETLRTAPGLRPHGLYGGLLSWDGQLADDARLVTAIARTAAGHGARILTRTRALSVSGSGALVRDELTGQELTIRARAVVNATGVWADHLVDGVKLRPSRGTHLVLRGTTLPGLTAGLHIPVPGESSRFVLVLPQGDGRVYVGLTDEPVDGPLEDEPTPPESDIGFLLDILNTALDTPVHRDDVVGAFAGLRPLLDDAPGDTTGGRTSDISRRHAVLTSGEGVVTIVGGKLTTYRRMAQDALDAALAARGMEAAPCRTARLPLVGAAAPAELAALPVPRGLLARYGTEATALHALGEADPRMREPVAEGVETTRAELWWAVRHEGALDASDLLDRRTRVGLVPADRAAALDAAREALDAAAQEPAGS
ncbi:FAD-dependent oxidoreductase, partial [Streptomyces sp. NPDC005877]